MGREEEGSIWGDQPLKRPCGGWKPSACEELGEGRPVWLELGEVTRGYFYGGHLILYFKCNGVLQDVLSKGATCFVEKSGSSEKG